MTVAATRTLVIQATHGWRSIDLGEIWAYRELLVIFAWRDVKVRYRQTLLGAVWVLGQPLVSMLLFTLIFNRVAKITADGGVPYPVFVMSGLLLWNFVAGGINRSGNSLIGASHLISKVYFPRLIVPLAHIATDLVDLAISATLLVALMIWYRVLPGPEILLAPVVILVAAIFALAVGLWVSALNVEYRDVRIVIPWILQIAMYAAPVVYPRSRLPERYQDLVALNPMTGIVETFRATLFGTPIPVGALAWSFVASLLLLFSGAMYFRRMERSFADVL
jgi:lipopolysaccharide transport system permease protein